MKIGMTELLVIFIVALVVIGPDKLPEFAKKLGEALRQFKQVSSEATKDIRESIVEPLEEAQRPLKEAMEPLTDLEKSIQKDMKDLNQSFSSIGKPSPAKKTEAASDEENTAEERSAGAEENPADERPAGDEENPADERPAGDEENSVNEPPASAEAGVAPEVSDSEGKDALEQGDEW